MKSTFLLMILVLVGSASFAQFGNTYSKTQSDGRYFKVADGINGYTAAQVDSIKVEQFKKYNQLKTLGSTCKTVSKIPDINSFDAVPPSDAALLLTEMENVPYSIVATSVRYYQQTAGVYTGDNNNRIGLYKLVGTTFTLVASIANDANLWTATAGVISKTFTSPYTAPANERLFIGILYNNSAQTTAPALTGSTGGTSYYDTTMWGTTYPLALQKTAQSDLTTPFDISTCTRVSGQPMFVIF